MKEIMPCLRIELTVAWLNSIMPNQTVKKGLKAKKIKLPQMIFFLKKKKTNKIFKYLLATFILQNFKNILRADPELSGCAIFGPKMAHLSYTKLFWYKPLLLLSFILWSFSLCKILKKFLQRMQSYWPLSFCKILKKFLKPIQIYEDVPFSGTKYPSLP